MIPLSDKDSVSKKYLQDKDRFADLFNFYLYDGQQVIQPEQLREMDTTAVSLPYGQEGKVSSVQKQRDIIKVVSAMTDGHCDYLLLAIEVQSELHYAMPPKNMLYDAMQYADQIYQTAKTHRKNQDEASTTGEFLSGFYKTDKLLPVITLTVYLDAAEWDAPRSLHEMLLIKDERLLPFIPDYKLNLITPANIDDTDFTKFHTELSPVLKYLKYSRSKDKLNEVVHTDPIYRRLDRDSAEVINIVTGSNLSIEQGKESIDMCQAIEEMRAESRAEGRAEGEAKGILKTLVSLVKDGILTLSEAAKRANMTVEDFEKQSANLT